MFGCYDDFIAAEAAAWRLRARHPGALAVSGVGAAVGEPDRVGLSVHWGWLLGGVALALYLGLRRRAHGPIELGIGGVATLGAVLVGVGIVPLPDLESIIEDAGDALGR